MVNPLEIEVVNIRRCVKVTHILHWEYNGGAHDTNDYVLVKVTIGNIQSPTETRNR